MASIIRPSAILKQSCFKAPATRTAFYSTKAPLASSLGLRPAQVQKKDGPISSQVAAFHASAKKEILPPLPRECRPCPNCF